MDTQFDIESLTLNEVEVLEEVSGRSIDAFMNEGTPKGSAMKALVFVMLKRSNPEATLEEAGETPLSQVLEALGATEVDEEGND